jgi:deoxyadenosine/deoxycytidine kinase
MVVMKKHIYVSVMGTMGSGKTTASKILARHFKWKLLEENFGENTFLARFYGDMKRWAFHSQTFFLMEKITQMFDTKRLLEHTSVIQDTPIIQDVYSYAKAQHVLGNIDDAEWKLYQKIYSSFEPHFPQPNVIVYLETSLSHISDRIEKRARSYEQKIPDSYLELLDMLNRKWISENKKIPIVTINTDGLNIVTSTKARTILIKSVHDKLQEYI